MRIRSTAAAAALLLPLAAVFAIPATANATTTGTLYVNKMSAFCSDTSTTAGTSATPFCTIQAAANAATAGDTVEIFGGAANAVVYAENVTITHSGTAAAPITFESIGRYTIIGEPFKTTAVTVQGADYVNLASLEADIVNIASSAHVSLSRSSVNEVNVEKGSSAVSVERDDIDSVSVAAGASDTVVAANIIVSSTSTDGVSVVGATGTDVANNSIEIESGNGVYGAGISVTGGASGTSVENNILSGTPGTLPELLVDASSASGTTEGYNLLDSTSSGAPYSWAGTGYTTVADFQAASGQGTSDVLDDSFSDATSATLRTDDAPAVSSANSAAPGLPATDYYGNPWTEYDRGASVLDHDPWAADRQAWDGIPIRGIGG